MQGPEIAQRYFQILKAKMIRKPKFLPYANKRKAEDLPRLLSTWWYKAEITLLSLAQLRDAQKLHR